MQRSHAYPWPDGVGAIVDELYEPWLISDEFYVRGSLSGGYSNAHVFAVDVRTEDGFDGEAILKIELGRLGEGPSNSEATKHARASAASPGFATRIPRLVKYHRSSRGAALLIQIAGQGLEYVQTWYRATYPKRAEAGSQLGTRLLTEWNYDRQIASTPCTPQNLLEQWLDYRLDPSKGKLLSFALQDLGLSECEHTFIYGGHWHPNPLAAAFSHRLDEISIRPLYGRLHGDLHGGNVLVRHVGDPKTSFHVIDFALFSESKPLLFDQAYLQLSGLLHDRGNTTDQRWSDIVSSIADFFITTERYQKHDDDRSLILMHQTICGQVQAELRRLFSDRVSQLDMQFFLAHVAAGLNFANKSIDKDARQKAFLYASIFFKCAIEHSNIDWPRYGPPLGGAEVNMTEVDSGLSQEIWSDCGAFDTARSAYILAVDSSVAQQDPDDLLSLAGLPWAVVLDFDHQSADNGFFFKVSDQLREIRAAHSHVPSDEKDPDVDFLHATCWLFTQGIGKRPSTLSENFTDWRRRCLPGIENTIKKLHHRVSGRAVRVISFGIDRSDRQYERIAEVIEDTFSEKAHFLYAGRDGDADRGRSPGQETRSWSVVQAAEAARYMMGPAKAVGSIQLPHRVEGDGGVRLKPVDPAWVRVIEEDLEVVHSGLAEATTPTFAFLRGAEITWPELSIDADVRRRRENALKQELVGALDQRRDHTVVLTHSAGAGGTTLAKRIAWELAPRFPTTVVRRYSRNTAVRVSELFHRCNLPVLLLIEAAIIPPPQREQLYAELKGASTNARAVILYVQRTSEEPSRDTPPTEGRRQRLFLSDELGRDETRDFLTRYLAHAPQSRHEALRGLAANPDLRRYRTPFFFGLFAFEREFVRVSDFVERLVSDLGVQRRRVLLYLALIRRFAQTPVTHPLLLTLFNYSLADRRTIDDLFGQDTSRLLVTDNERNAVSMIHPVIAEEVLTLLSSPSNAGADWRRDLVEISTTLIDDFAAISGEEGNDDLISLLNQLFIYREYYDVDTGHRRNFSELINKISNDERGQHKVLKRLTEKFPLEAHYWNHLGRHSNYVLEEDYQIALGYFDHAIEHDPENDIHYHAKGMVYRFEIRRRLDNCLRVADGDLNVPAAERVLDEIRPLFDEAATCFLNGRQRTETSEYPFVTHVQMILESVARLHRLSGGRRPEELLRDPGKLGAWARAELNTASELLIQARSLRAEDTKSERVSRYESELVGAFGNFEAMMVGLQQLLQEPGVERRSIRRILTNAMFMRREQDWSKLKSRDLRRMVDLMEANLREDPTHAHDMRTWFQAVRRLPEFDISNAIHRLSVWVNEQELIDGYYYLYILNFMLWYKRQLRDTDRFERYKMECARLAGRLPLTRRRSYEWLAKEPGWCPLAHQGELGEWAKSGHDSFYTKTDNLKRVEGVIAWIDNPQRGEIEIVPERSGESQLAYRGSVRAFFAPRTEFRQGRDENVDVSFFLGFSYEGLRAWSVERTASTTA